MNHYLHFPYLTSAILAVLAGAVMSLPRFRVGPKSRVALASLVCALIPLGLCCVEWTSHPGERLVDPLIPWLGVDAVSILPQILFILVAAASICVAPRRDTGHLFHSGIMLLVLGTEIVYASSGIFLTVIGWWITCVPFVFAFFGENPARRTTMWALVSSAVLLTVAACLPYEQDLAHGGFSARCALLLFFMAVVIRKGLFPFHGWTVRAFESGPLLPLVLLFNAHLGALLITRAASDGSSLWAHGAFDCLCILALVAAVLTSLRGFTETKPRRLLAFVCISQASFILAGLSSFNSEGVMGAMLHWMVVTIASTGLIAILRILEVRVLDVTDPSAPLGLAVRAPRLATFFLLCGLALVGLPGTLGYCAEDLLFHGAQQKHPVLGISLVVATAFNAINLFRLYSVLFLGVQPSHVIEIPDALPRERWPLVALVAILVAGGLVPSIPVRLRKPALDAVHIEDAHAKPIGENGE